MDPLKQKKLQREAAHEAAKGIMDTADKEDRSLTETEQERFDGLTKRFNDLDAEIKRRQELAKNDAKLNAHEPTKTTPEIALPEQRVEIPHYPASRLVGFKGPDPYIARRNAYCVGKWLIWQVRGNPAGQRDAGDWLQRYAPEMRVSQEGINTKGGATVPIIMSNTVIDLFEQYGVLRQHTSVEPMSTDFVPIPRITGGLTAYAIGETPTNGITESDTAWDNVELTARKWGVLNRMSTDLAEDSIINFAEKTVQKGALAIMTSQDNAGIDGDGTSTHHGIVGIRTKMVDGNHAGSVVDAVSGDDKFSDLTITSFESMLAALPDFAFANAKWFIHRSGFSQSMERLMNAAGGNTNRDLSAGALPQFLGYDVIFMNSMPKVTTTLDDLVMCIFGDMEQAVTIGDRRDIRLDTTASRYFENDQIGIKLTSKFDINVHDIGGVAATDRGSLIGLLGTA